LFFFDLEGMRTIYGIKGGAETLLSGKRPDMLPAMAATPSIAIVGPGRLGTALAAALKQAGYKITEVVSRNNVDACRRATKLAKIVGGHARTITDARLDADVVWFCVPDREISTVSRKVAALASWSDKVALHSSGALVSDELDSLRQRGAAVASVHPFMTFVRGSRPRLAGVPFALEGDARAVKMARRIASDLGAGPFTIARNNKVAYHAWGAFASPLIIVLLAMAEQVARETGQSASHARNKMRPIVNQTIENYFEFGAARAFSGPLVRGDAEIVKKHLRVLTKIPGAQEVYLSLARAAVRYLPVEQRKKLEKVLTSRRKH
jgi:predicted short-subunit dehydrogenase-like oxidoreductase (DUF2520 family)